jgi:hypothetical protein
VPTTSPSADGKNLSASRAPVKAGRVDVILALERAGFYLEDGETARRCNCLAEARANLRAARQVLFAVECQLLADQGKARA